MVKITVMSCSRASDQVSNVCFSMSSVRFVLKLHLRNRCSQSEIRLEAVIPKQEAGAT